MNVKEEIFYLIRNEIRKQPLPFNTEYNVKEILFVSKRHDIAHLVSDALLKSGIVSDNEKVTRFLAEERKFAVYRETQMSYAFEKISGILAENGIDYIPLKGIVMRGLYPEPWMRTSCDLDILIREEDVKKATKALIDGGLTTDGKKNYHDIHFYYGQVHLELHFSICEHNKQLDKGLSQVWDYSKKVTDFEYREIPEYYAFHHVAHMAYHLLSGGCGVRPFIDLWLLKEKNYYDEEKLFPLLEQCALVGFYRAACRLSEIWMNGGEYDDLTAKMEEYILSGGVYGSECNANSVGAASCKGKRRYLLKIAFPPYETMCLIYPSLKKHKILLPFCYVRRVFAKVFGKDRKLVKKKIRGTISQSEDKIALVSDLLKDLDLKK